MEVFTCMWLPENNDELVLDTEEEHIKSIITTNSNDARRCSILTTNWHKDFKSTSRIVPV